MTSVRQRKKNPLNWRQVLAKKMGLDERLFTVLFGLLIIVAMSTIVLLLNGLNITQLENVRDLVEAERSQRLRDLEAAHSDETLEDFAQHGDASEEVVVKTSFASSSVENEEGREALRESVKKALEKIRSGEVNYPQFVNLLSEAGVLGYTAEVAAFKITFHGKLGERVIEQGVPAVDSRQSPGRFSQGGIQAALEDAQKKIIDHPTFLKRIYESGITEYEVDIPNRQISYKGVGGVYVEPIPS